jgi:Uncharacterised nucleotidyltransferase
VGVTASSPERLARLAISLQADLAAAELFSALEQERLDAMLLRGPAIARRLYEDGSRSYGDCDVLVPERNRAAVEGVLARLGYEAYTVLSTEQHWRRTNNRAEVDLHRVVHGVRGPHEAFLTAMWAHRTVLELRGQAIPIPDLPATTLVITLHAAQHGAVVGHTVEDLTRALARFDSAVWGESASLAAAVEAQAAFRQALAMLPAGLERLADLGLEPKLTARAVLRDRGVEVPDYLMESLSSRERATILLRRVWPSRVEMAVWFDPRVEESTPRLLAAHARRIARLPVRAVRLGVGLRRARRDLSSRDTR